MLDGTDVARRDEPQPMPVSPFSPRSLEAAMALAEFLCRARTIPEFLRDNPADMLLVIEQAARWRMSPFFVAQCAYSVRGKQGFEGKLIHAAIESSPLISGYIDYRFAGEGEKRSVTVSATRRGETEARAITVRLVDARTSNEQWAKQPHQQLCYHAVRVWARRWAASALAGAYAPEEFDDDTSTLPHVGEVVQLASVPVPQLPPPEPVPAPPESTPKITVRQFLAALSAQMQVCDSRDEVERIVLSEPVLRASRTLKGVGRTELSRIVAAGLARFDEEPAS